jgi:hypothetical protein
MRASVTRWAGPMFFMIIAKSLLGARNKFGVNTIPSDRAVI